MNAETAAGRPVRTWRPMIFWSAGILLALGLAWFVAAVAVPCWRVRIFVKDEPPNGLQNWERLGGERRACERLGRYLCWPDWLAPHKDRAVELLACCDGGPERVTAVLCDERAPLASRLAIAESLGRAWDSDMDKGDAWRHEALVKAMKSRIGQLRVAAAGELLGHPELVLWGSVRDSALAELLVCLKDGDVLVRREAARALRSLATNIEGLGSSEVGRRFAPTMEPALQAALDDPDPEVRAEAAEALKHKLVKPVKRLGRGYFS